MGAMERTARFPTPLGPMEATTGPSGALIALGFVGPDGAEGETDSSPVARQLEEYFAGRRRAFDLPLDPRGSAFEREVWEALLEVPFGKTSAYGAIAERIGRPGSARAVGRAVGANPIAVVIPCHRAVGAGGALTGYAGGMERKRALLALEGSLSLELDV